MESGTFTGRLVCNLHDNVAVNFPAIRSYTSKVTIHRHTRLNSRLLREHIYRGEVEGVNRRGPAAAARYRLCTRRHA